MSERTYAVIAGTGRYVPARRVTNLDVEAPRQKPFYPFARVTAGMDVVDRINQGDRIVRVTIEESAK